MDYCGGAQATVAAALRKTDAEELAELRLIAAWCSRNEPNVLCVDIARKLTRKGCVSFHCSFDLDSANGVAFPSTPFGLLGVADTSAVVHASAQFPLRFGSLCRLCRRRLQRSRSRASNSL